MNITPVILNMDTILEKVGKMVALANRPKKNCELQIPEST